MLRPPALHRRFMTTATHAITQSANLHIYSLRERADNKRYNSFENILERQTKNTIQQKITEFLLVEVGEDSECPARCPSLLNKLIAKHLTSLDSIVHVFR